LKKEIATDGHRYTRIKNVLLLRKRIWDADERPGTVVPYYRAGRLSGFKKIMFCCSKKDNSHGFTRMYTDKKEIIYCNKKKKITGMGSNLRQSEQICVLFKTILGWVVGYP